MCLQCDNKAGTLSHKTQMGPAGARGRRLTTRKVQKLRSRGSNSPLPLLAELYLTRKPLALDGPEPQVQIDDKVQRTKTTHDGAILGNANHSE